jgi:hypothetical protein
MLKDDRAKAYSVISTRVIVAMSVVVLYASLLTAIYYNFPEMKR